MGKQIDITIVEDSMEFLHVIQQVQYWVYIQRK
jgi:hypothetical protein